MKFEARTCVTCFIEYCVPEGFTEKRREDGRSFWCPNGCCLVFNQGKSADQIRAEEAEKVARETQAQLNSQKHARLVAEKALQRAQAAAKSAIHRTAHGTCTHCNRTFKQLAAHMKSKHGEHVLANSEPKALLETGRQM